MRKTLATLGLSAAALVATAGAASASTGADTDAAAEANSYTEHNHVQANGAGSLINVSDILTNADIANGLLAGGVNVDADVLDEGVNVGK